MWPDVGWNTAQDEQVRESIDDLSRVELSFHPDRDAFPAVSCGAPRFVDGLFGNFGTKERRILTRNTVYRRV